jgi:NADPH:quinone reductase-like Zn-dependent oxidoreductase
VKAWRIKGGGGSLTLEDLPIPTPREGGVTIRMWATPVLTYMADVLAGKLSTYAFPDKAFTPGTNGAGEITEVGRGVYGLRRGDHVILNPHYIANETGADPAQILIGLTRISADSAPMQSDWPDGTFAEYAHMPAAALTKVSRDCGFRRIVSPRSENLPCRLAAFTTSVLGLVTQNSQGRQACRSSGRVAKQRGIGRQSKNRKGNRPDGPALAPRAR